MLPTSGCGCLSMWLFEQLQKHGSPSGVHGLLSSAAYKDLEDALYQRKEVDELVIGAIIAAITGASERAWPPKLLQRTLDLVFKGVEGVHLSLVSVRIIQLSCPSHL